jgi:hypothetical protein
MSIHKRKEVSHNYRQHTMDNDDRSQKTTTTSYAVIAIVAALAVLGVVAITVATIPLQQEAEAVGCKNSKAFNASKGRCFQP